MAEGNQNEQNAKFPIQMNKEELSADLSQPEQRQWSLHPHADTLLTLVGCLQTRLCPCSVRAGIMSLNVTVVWKAEELHFSQYKDE